jgi:hypothetical protein
MSTSQARIGIYSLASRTAAATLKEDLCMADIAVYLRMSALTAADG